jgi:CheY-like chemotaxis protein
VLHGGTVSVDSDGRGRGATFRIRLPVPVEPPAPSDPPLRARPTTLEGIRVLAVDDSPDALDVVATALASAGARVRTATSGAAALALVEEELPDVLLCDLAMPDMDGIDVLRQVRARLGPEGRRLRAIALSAHATEEHRSRSRAAGFEEHLVKPCAIDVLTAAIASMLSREPESGTNPRSPEPAAAPNAKEEH